jgi:type I restriction enzyme S subunit
MPNLNTSILAACPFLIPPKNEQRAIAHILGTLDDKIELNRRMNETLEVMAQALFKSWFVDFDPVRANAEGRHPGLPQPFADLFPERFEGSELGEIPRGWCVASLEQLFRDNEECVLTGPFGSNLHAHDYREDGVPLILVKHVVDGQILEDGLPRVGDHKLPDLERYRLRLGDIVFTRVGAVGRSAYVHTRCVGWLISGQMLRVRVPDWSTLHPRYLAQLFLEKAFTDMVEGHALGTTRPSLNTGLLRAFRFIAPSGDLMQLFAKKVAVFDALVQTNRDESRTLTALRDTLLPKLISGELQVTDAERFIGRVV